ncbi:malto-oligosyltrehalose synthase [Methylobacterium nodulans]|uniref:4-alpha-glucanotransferase n=1 Tax=Methylobacterium nodulans (strain LMG 21967 / CNCM I-2342 / ORS 2060) TaxID=460265 RepID=B8IPJ2_METNO|nr:malto-oligosyltrehalose synthase [Methylobacterium nodulans]ACL62284.1 malto-oligosyltrehalose synthase [Methylobacterium nodulans ORS 2060]
MAVSEDVVARLARLAGLAADYVDAFGSPIETPLDARRGVLAALGLPSGTEEEARSSLARIEALRHGLVPPLVPVEARRASRVPVRADRNGTLNWRVVDERGSARDGRAPIALGGGTPAFDLPPLTPGYHRLTVTLGDKRAEATVIAAPQRCWRPRALGEEGARDWGLAVQLYGLRSAENLGIGTYTDAGRAATDAGARGAAFLGLSPVHALFPSDRHKVSPYSPSSRLFLETLYIDPQAVPGFAGSRAASLLDAMRPQVERLREAALVDHAGVWEVLGPVLDALWQESRARAGQDTEFLAFRAAGGESLEAHATFDALSEHFRRQGASWLGEWPEEYRRNGTPAVLAFAAEHPERIAYYAWLQFIADRQLAAAAAAAQAAGMRLGLYRDLAVGADRGGSEVWSNPERFATGLSIGAPPDLLAPNGQDWGLPPFDPLELERDGLAAFRALVQANMRHAGAIRIDHAFQLARLYLIPAGQGAKAGAYVAMPFEPMLAVLRLESHRAKCLVIAEDLGTAPQGFSDALMQAGILSYRILAFERGEGGSFKSPEAYPRDALCAITTHDLPTFVGWWRGVDTDLRQSLGLYDGERADAERAERVTERRRLTEALHSENLQPGAEPPDQPPFDAAARYLARAPSVLTAVQYEDVLGEVSQANMPGITDGYPNWRRKLDRDLDAIAAPGGPLAKLAASLASEDRGPRSGAARLASEPPRATYRLQFHKDFTFDDAVGILPYLAKLGISHVYASPIHKARPGSTHGYDIVDHREINPELGGEAAFIRFSDALKAHGLKLLLDIVPNHMGVGGADNPWWLSVLEWGALSPASEAFDIDWERIGAHNKLVVPFLGDRYGEALEKGDLKLTFDPAEGGFSVWHHEHKFPICPLSYPIVLDRALAALPEAGDEPSAEVLAISERLRRMSEETDPERLAGFPAEADGLKHRLAEAVKSSPELQQAIDRAVALVNGFKGHPDSFGALHRILEAQSYRLAHWRVAASDINYRRFFDVNSLAGLRVERPAVFEGAHAMLFRQIRAGRIDGLRIDHIDGLADPAGYVRALQEAVGPGFYIVVEKILEPGERLRPWLVAGTTGYDVLNQIDGLFVDRDKREAVRAFYAEATGTDEPYGVLLRQVKAEILETSFASELEVLTSDLKRVADADRRTRDFSVNALRQALTEIVARFPVYRSYMPQDLDGDELEAEDVRLIEGAVRKAKRHSRLPDRSVHDFAQSVLLGRIDTDSPGRPSPEIVRRVRRRFQQLTGPVMAKSLEDTLFYRFVELLALNEVGGDPGEYGLTAEHFHALQAARARDWPNALITTATHDTKRGEDARARLLALSAMPELWQAEWARWREIAEPHLTELEGEPAPDANDQWMFFQAILGAWPLDLLDDVSDAGTVEAFRQRLGAYAEKALRESKRWSSWVNIDEAYEGAVAGLFDALIAPGSEFLTAFRPFARRLAEAGMVTGLARTVLKCTLPGLPDTYQGTEFWDFSFVDPDNRRPVDYAARARALAEDGPIDEMLAQWPDGRIKQAVLARLLADRAAEPTFYADADYRPVEAEGSRARQLLAFIRGEAATGGELLVVVPRQVADLAGDLPRFGEAFFGTVLPVQEGSRWRDLVTGQELGPEGGRLPVDRLFRRLPLAVLRRLTASS